MIRESFEVGKSVDSVFFNNDQLLNRLVGSRTRKNTFQIIQ